MEENAGIKKILSNAREALRDFVREMFAIRQEGKKIFEDAIRQTDEEKVKKVKEFIQKQS